MAWNFETDDDFQEKLEWIRQFVEQDLIPLEPIKDELSEDQWTLLEAPLKEQVKQQGLWACYLEKELGGQGLGQLALAQMNLIRRAALLARFQYVLET